MSTKTTFKRIALVAVAALGLGVLSVAPSSAAVVSETLTLSASASTVTVGDTASVTSTHQWTASAVGDSALVTIACTAPTGASCPTLGNASGTTISIALMPDSTSVTSMTGTSNALSAYTDSSNAAGLVKSVVGLKLVTTTATTPGVYNVTVTTRSPLQSNVTATWTVTVVADNITVASLGTTFTSDQITGQGARARFATTDSAIVVDKGTAGTSTVVGYINGFAMNSASETFTAGTGKTSNICLVTTPDKSSAWCSLTVVATGGAQISVDDGTTKGISATMRMYNQGTLQHASETVIVYSTGTAGTGSITFANSAGVTVKTLTLTFAGSPASAVSPSLSDTVVVKGQASVVLSAIVKDASAALKSGTVYLYSSDSRVAGSTLSTGTNAANADTCSYSTTLSRFSCAVSVKDTGTATLYIRDSYTVAASTWVSDGITLTVSSDVMASAAVTFDKETYVPGERAVITITAKDVNGRALAAKSDNYSTAFTSIIPTGPSVTGVSTALICGTNCSTDYATTTFAGLNDSGIETRVVTMPNVGGNVSIAFKYPTLYSTVGGAAQTYTTVTASTKVVDAQAAAAKDAADAATDAALEATDAAYAATDAANIAAEAADAATAAAEAATDAANAAKDSADAATAAVEELATSVAKLMAALQAQITTLAKVVAKIAVKVKA